MLTKGAIGNLINRYKAVLTKCNLINVFGSLAVASMLVAGSTGMALAAKPLYESYEYIHVDSIADTDLAKVFKSDEMLLTLVPNSHNGIDDFIDTETSMKQIGLSTLVGYLDNNVGKNSYNYNLPKDHEGLIIGGRYSGVWDGDIVDALVAAGEPAPQKNMNKQVRRNTASVDSVTIKMTPNTTLYGEINAGGLAIGAARLDDKNRDKIRLVGHNDRPDEGGNDFSSHVETANIEINGGTLLPMDKNYIEVGHTRIRAGGISHNNAKASVGTSTITIKGNAGKNDNPSIPDLPYTIIMGGGVNGGYYASPNANGEDEYTKVGYYYENGDASKKVWHNTTEMAVINIEKMAYSKNILDADGKYSPKETTWLGSTIFAGGDNSYVGNSTINLKDSTVGTVFAGGECFAVTDETHINLDNSAILAFYSGGLKEAADDKEVGARHITHHEGIVGNVSVSMKNNSALHTWADEVFDVVSSSETSHTIKTDNLKTWKGGGITFTADNTENRIYLRTEGLTETNINDAQTAINSHLSANGGGNIDVIRTCESDTPFGSSISSSISAGWAKVNSDTFTITSSPAKSVTTNSTTSGTVVHLTGYAEVKDYYSNPEQHSDKIGEIYNTKYSETELLTNNGNKVSVNVENGSTLRLGNETEHTGGTLSGSISLDSGTIDVVGGRFTLNEVKANAGDTIIVGSANSSAKLILGNDANLGGATVFLDPEWTGIAEQDVIENATHMIRTNGKVDANYIVGQNSVLTLAKGMSASDAEQATYDNFNALAESGVHWGEDGITAALSLLTPHTIADGMSITVDGSKQHQGANTPAVVSSGSTSDAYFAKDSLFMVGKDALGQKDASGNDIPALSGDKLTIADGAKIAMPTAESGKSYTVAKFTNTERQGNQTGWTGDNVLINKVVNGEATLDADGNLVITATEATINSAYLPQNAIDAWRKNHGEGVGSDFFSAALASDVDDTLSVNTVNEVTQASVTAGVQNTALRLSDAASENVLNHLSLGNFDSGNSIHADGTDFWATPMYGNTYTSGMSASGVSVRGNYGGIAFGADTQVGEVLGGKVRVGAALNGGGGKSETKGTVTTTQNDYNFGGINLYAGWNKGNLNVIAGLGYGIGDNEVEMGLPASMKMGTAKADVDTSVITADLRAEYQLNTNWLDILPHAGVRYTALRTDSHDLKVNGSVLNSVDAETQHIVQFPIGVTLTKNIDAWGWNVKPQVDVSVIPAAGDKDMNTKVRFSGVDAVDSIDTRIMDSTSWSGMVGIQASKGNLSLGLNYGIQASSHETDQRVQASIGWKF